MKHPWFSRVLRRGILYGLVVGSLVLAACGGYGSSPPPTTAPSGGAQPETKAGEVGVTARYGSFNPSAITVKGGESVSIKLTSADTSHTFTIPELSINVQVGAGQTVSREIKVDKAGTYTFYCAIIGHRAAGMEGTLKVE